MNIADKIRAIQQAKNWSQVKLAEQLGTSQSTVNRWLRGAEPEGHRRDMINDLYRSAFGADSSETRLVPLKGYIGAGGHVEALEHGPEEVEAPAISHPDTVAAIVKGDSQMPMLSDGWIIYWSRAVPVEEMVNKLAVVQLSDGRIMVKTIRLGSSRGLWTLTSFNAADIVDVPADWAAPIDWIKPRS